MNFLVFCITISSLIILLDLSISVLSFKKKTRQGALLSITCLFAAIVTISYLFSILTINKFAVSVLSSIYFISIDFMLHFLVLFVHKYTKRSKTKFYLTLLYISRSYLIFDFILFILNPLTHWAVDYIPRNTVIAHYEYSLKWPYYIHLIYTYILVLASVLLLITKAIQVAKEYRRQYLYSILIIFLIVGLNAIFLFIDNQSMITLLDYSIWGYSIAAFALYWSSFQYTKNGMLKECKYSIFDNIDQGIVLFDYNDELILFNQKSVDFLKGVHLTESIPLEDFLHECDIVLTSEIENGHYSLPCYIHAEEVIRPLRCDYRKLFNDKQQVIGRLFVFSSIGAETDLLTGFQNWDDFSSHAQNASANYIFPTIVSVFDINGLSLINQTKGHNYGDQLIKSLSDLIRKHFPKDCYFIRGLDARLIVLNHSASMETIRQILHQINQEFDGFVQYATSIATDEKFNILVAIKQAEKAITTKKLLDKESRHSAIITSLVRTLKECDNDTEAHVKRTQHMGELLGQRINLTDVQQSQLNLLCVLHDIGKVGVPLEILNKPGKLTPEEWHVIQSHVNKGYQIAISAPELADIADLIHSHHESWDGSGYPDGLSRESIPLLSRIIAVLDAYDAMVNDRPYRKAMSTQEAIKELQRNAGKQFDPSIVVEFIALLNSKTISTNPSHLISQSPINMGENLSSETHTVSANNNDMPISDDDLDDTLNDDLNDDTTLKIDGSINSIQYSLYTLDEDMYIINVDDNFKEITGYSPEDICSLHLKQIDLIPPKDRTQYLCLINEQLAHKSQAYLEHKIVKKDGLEIYVYCAGRKYYDSVSRTTHSEITIAKCSDTHFVKWIAQQEAAKARIRLQKWEETYRRDSLTGLLRHAAFKNDIETRLFDKETKVLFLMIDIDKFKNFNDKYGHHEGDEFLIYIAQAIENSLRKSDLACRMGGDEFAAALFFNQGQGDQIINHRANQIFEQISISLKLSENYTSISVGAAISDSNLCVFNKLYEAADKALYHSKLSGRNSITFFKDIVD